MARRNFSVSLLLVSFTSWFCLYTPAQAQPSVAGWSPPASSSSQQTDTGNALSSENDTGAGKQIVDDPYEENDTSLTAALITPGLHLNLRLYDEDWFKVYLREGDVIAIPVVGFYLTSYYPSGVHADDGNVHMCRTIDETGYWYFRVTGTYDGHSYDLNILLNPATGRPHTYKVYGGPTMLYGSDALHPELHGYTFLGTASQWAVFAGSYNYYEILVEPGNIVAIDAVFDSSLAGLTLKNWDNNCMGPYNLYVNSADGELCMVGLGQTGNLPGGYLILQGTGLGPVTVYLPEASARLDEAWVARRRFLDLDTNNVWHLFRLVIEGWGIQKVEFVTPAQKTFRVFDTAYPMAGKHLYLRLGLDRMTTSTADMIFPQGRYLIRLTFHDGLVLPHSHDLHEGSWPKFPEILYPASKQTNVPTDVLIQWRAVSAIHDYEAFVEAGQPVVGFDEYPVNWASVSLRIPQGVLEGGTQYRLHLRANGTNHFASETILGFTTGGTPSGELLDPLPTGYYLLLGKTDAPTGETFTLLCERESEAAPAFRNVELATPAGTTFTLFSSPLASNPFSVEPLVQVSESLQAFPKGGYVLKLRPDAGGATTNVILDTPVEWPAYPNITQPVAGGSLAPGSPITWTYSAAAPAPTGFFEELLWNNCIAGYFLRPQVRSRILARGLSSTSETLSLWLMAMRSQQNGNNTGFLASMRETSFTVQIPTKPTVTVTAPDGTASEPGTNTGNFRISRTGSTAVSLSVYFTMSGTATNGTDYNTLSSPKVIPAGSSYVDVTLVPRNDTISEVDETAILTLSANSGYSIGSPNTATVTIQDDDIAAPSNLTATAVSPTQINLSWQDNSNNEQGFKIERKTGSAGTWSQIATVPANVKTYQNTGLLPGIAYFYQLRAYNAAGQSGYSNVASATTFVREISITVKDENGNTIPGAQIHHHSSARYDAHTCSGSGVALIQDIQIGDRLRAEKLIQRFPSNMGNHERGLYEIYLTSDIVNNDGTVDNVINSLQDRTLVVKKRSPLVKFHLIVSFDYESSEIERDDWEITFIGASNRLYDATDGQMCIGTLKMYNNREHWGDADVRIVRQWNYTPNVGYGNTGPVTFGSGDFLCHDYLLAHEMGHYLFGLYDENRFLLLPSFCTISELHLGSETEACLMDNAERTEFCYARNHHSPTNQPCSCWETIVGRFYDSAARWSIISPAERGNIVCPGPFQGQIAIGTELLYLNKGVGEWNPSGAFRIDLGAKDPLGIPVGNVAVWLRKTSGQLFYIGTTEFTLGLAQVAGANIGDIVQLPRYQTEILLEGRQNIQVVLDRRTKGETIAYFYSPTDRGVTLHARANSQIKSAMVTEVYQEALDGSRQNVRRNEAMTPVDGSQRSFDYSYVFDPQYPSFGSYILEIDAVSLPGSFRVDRLAAAQATMLCSRDGVAELSLPAGTLAHDTVVSLARVEGPIYGTKPDEYEPVINPYEIGTCPVAGTLQKNATLRFFYSHGTEDFFQENTLTVFRFDESRLLWVPIETVRWPDSKFIACSVSTLSRLAVFAKSKATGTSRWSRYR